MNIYYFRESKKDFSIILTELQSQLKEIIKKDNWALFVLQDTNILDKFFNFDPKILILPWLFVLVFKKEDKTYIGILKSSFLGSITQDQEIYNFSFELEEKLEKLIDEVSGAGPRKIKNIKIYATTTCPYCKMEMDWLKSKKIDFQVSYVDLNPLEAQKMIEETNQMGVPVTKIEFADSEPEFIIGFEKEYLERLLNKFYK